MILDNGYNNNDTSFNYMIISSTSIHEVARHGTVLRQAPALLIPIQVVLYWFNVAHYLRRLHTSDPTRAYYDAIPVNTTHLYNIYTMTAQRLRR